MLPRQAKKKPVIRKRRKKPITLTELQLPSSKNQLLANHLCNGFLLLSDLSQKTYDFLQSGLAHIGMIDSDQSK